MLGLGVYDYIVKNQYDSETGETYQAMTCANNDEMAARCKVMDAKKCVYSVKATAEFNNDICILLRNGLMNGKIEFLISDVAADDYLAKKYKWYNKLTLSEQQEVKAPYMEMTLAQYELIKLEYETTGGRIKVKEQSGMRKDRYSSIVYNYWLACQLEQNLKPKNMDMQSLLSKFYMREGSYK